MKRLFLVRVVLALAIFAPGCVRAQSGPPVGCSNQPYSEVNCCNVNFYEVEPPSNGLENGWMYTYNNYCCGRVIYLPIYNGRCYLSFKNRPELLHQMLKRFPDDTFLTASCSGDLVRLSAADLSGPQTEMSPFRSRRSLHLE